MNSLRRLWAITQKELRQLARDRLTFGMVVMIPLIQLLLFGYAINTDVRQIPVGLVEMSQSVPGRLLVEAVKASQVVHIKQQYVGVQQAEAALTRGEVRAVLVLPADLSRRLSAGETAGQWLVDGSDTMIAGALLGLRNMPLSDLKPDLKPAPPTFETVLYFNPARRSAVNIVPGLLGVILTMTMIMFTSAAIVRERERGNLELLISTLAQTQLQAMQMTVFILLPSILLSGFMFPYEGMPLPAQWIAEVLPATHFMRLIRGIVLRGGELAELLPDVLWLAGFTLLVLTLAAHRFKKSLD
ncbi:ABC transporter permease [Aeromonas hydrophila]|uniref:ABC transporter permease n=1 Tax=Aeromonas hydrophila TaxID=644 RepID=UPI0005A6AB6E|nr:ABC transporter permease [Aeromonas hydrophila]